MPLPVIGAGLGAFLGSMATNATNVALARGQNRFQERMSNTAHQRQAADLRKAGINPLLGTGGVGASSAVGARATVEDSVSKGIHSGLEAQMRKKELELLAAKVQTEVTQAQLNNARNTEITTLTTPRSNLLNSQKALFDMDTATKQKLLGLVAQHMSSETARNLASALQSRSASQMQNAETILKRFQATEAENLSEAQKDWWLRTLGPYLHSAGQFGRALNAGAVPFVAGASIGKKVFEKFKD